MMELEDADIEKWTTQCPLEALQVVGQDDLLLSSAFCPFILAEGIECF